MKDLIEALTKLLGAVGSRALLVALLALLVIWLVLRPLNRSELIGATIVAFGVALLVEASIALGSRLRAAYKVWRGHK